MTSASFLSLSLYKSVSEFTPERSKVSQDRNRNLAKNSSQDEPRPKERKLTSSFRDWWVSGRVSGLNMQEVIRCIICIHINTPQDNRNSVCRGFVKGWKAELPITDEILLHCSKSLSILELTNRCDSYFGLLSQLMYSYRIWESE